ncbi:YdeI/OmpD-associated family protein [Nostoc ellipsosporum NOK]|nr:YdeI/OmpD-associated family protein [Nostoc ellipsosporum NOK]
MYRFEAILEIIGVNPFVFVPEEILDRLFADAKKDKGKIPVAGTVNGKKYIQTLVKYSGAWRLYINNIMLPGAKNKVGERLKVAVRFDDADRSIVPHPKLVQALKKNKQAGDIFDSLAPSLQKEIVRYISFLKTETAIDENVKKAIGFLQGKNRFIGRDGLQRKA